MPGPAEAGYELFKLISRIRDLEAQAARLEQSTAMYAEEATVTAFSGGAQCTVQYDTGTSRLVGWSMSYTPTVGHRVLVINYRWGPAVKGIAVFRISI